LPPGGVVTLGEGAPNKYFVNLLADFKPEEAPIRPAALAVFRQHAASAGKDFPTSLCLPAGVPAANLLPIPFRIVQAPGMTVFLYEGDTTFRQVYTDLRRHPVDPQPAWLGYAVGKWEGDTFVVDTLGFNDKSWLDAFGHPHSDALRVTERFRRLDFGRIQLQITVDDSKSYTRPFTVKTNLILHADSDLLESFCAENEKDIVHLQAK
jgi:hypothetical protein